MSCGKATKHNSSQSAPASSQQRLSFESFLSSKNKDRASHFQPKRKVKKVSSDDVTINISVLHQSDDGQFRQMAGSRIPLAAKSNWSALQLKRAAYDKLKRYNRLIAEKSFESVKLVYRSGETVRFVPGTTTLFTLESYKEDLGVRYNAIVLYLQAIKDDESSDDEYLEKSVFSNKAKEATKIPSIWPKCSHTVIGTFCLICQQNAAYEESLRADQVAYSKVNSAALESSTESDKFSPSVLASGNANLEDEAPPSSSANSQSPVIDHDYAHITQQVQTNYQEDHLFQGDDSSDEIVVTKPVTLHRLMLQSELVELFQDEFILDYELKITLIDPRGQKEEGVGHGIARDVFCQFFAEFIPGNTVGRLDKVPTIRHDMSRNHWSSIARILLYSFRSGYFPLAISPAFLISSIFGEEKLTSECLLQSFKNYITSEEKKIINKAIDGGIGSDKSFDDDLLEFLSDYKCYRRPSNETIQQIVHELAHQEIIQKPRYVANCFSEIFAKVKMPKDFESPEKLSAFYSKRIPSAKKLIRCFDADAKTDQEKSVLDHLCRYVKSLREGDLRKLLIFLTGADLMPENKIDVSFKKDQVPRAPVARICVPLLELSDSYPSYNDLAHEFNSILNNKESFAFTFA